MSDVLVPIVDPLAELASSEAVTNSLQLTEENPFVAAPALAPAVELARVSEDDSESALDLLALATDDADGVLSIDDKVDGVLESEGSVQSFVLDLDDRSDYFIAIAADAPLTLFVNDDFGTPIYTSFGDRLFLPRYEPGVEAHVVAGADGVAFEITLSRAFDLPSGPTTTSILKPGAPVTGAFEFSRDTDWHAIDVTAGSRYDVSLTRADGGVFGGLDIFDGDRQVIASDLDRDGQLSIVAPETGTLFVSTSSWGVGDYSLAVEETNPVLAVVAAGTGGSGRQPGFAVRVDGRVVGRGVVSNAGQDDPDPEAFERFEFDIGSFDKIGLVEVVFDTDFYDPEKGVDVNLHVAGVEYGGVFIDVERHGVYQPRWTGARPDGAPSEMAWNGVMRFFDVAETANELAF